MFEDGLIMIHGYNTNNNENRLRRVIELDNEKREYIAVNLCSVILTILNNITYLFGYNSMLLIVYFTAVIAKNDGRCCCCGVAVA